MNSIVTYSRSQIEESLAVILREILGLDQVGINDNFIDMGGESILAMQFLNRVRALYGVELSPIILFSPDSSIATIAATIDRLRTTANQQQTV